MSRERPILMSSPMVRAILAGKKSQTRRALRIQPLEILTPQDRRRQSLDRVTRKHDGKRYWFALTERGETPADNHGKAFRCRYGEVGDRLWVRETFAIESNEGLESADVYPPPHSDGRPIKWTDDPDNGRVWCQPHYRATDPEPHIVCEDDGEREDGDDRTRWRRSIFMPRWASRITLEITNVRVQRVQEISEEDALAEGVSWEPGQQERNVRKWGEQQTARMAYADLWDSINHARGFGWESNPWCWAITFRRTA